MLLSFQTSLEAQRFAKEQKKNCVLFDEMGIYKLFFAIPDKSMLRACCSCLKPLVTYDEVHSGELVRTLYLYLNHRRSIKTVSEIMFCHRNTANYRIGQIKNLLEVDLEDEQDIFQLQLAFHVMQYMSDVHFS